MITELWAVHVEGPDDIIAAKDRAEADARAAEINASYEAFKRMTQLTASEHDPRWHAVVIPWDGTPEEHAMEVARGDERWEG